MKVSSALVGIFNCARGIRSLIDLIDLGITEVQIIQWYVEEGAHIEEWKPLCQYQSDKAVDDVCTELIAGYHGH